MCDMTHLHVRLDSLFICVTGLMFMCDMADAYV